jgi:hypothetical protein
MGEKGKGSQVSMAAPPLSWGFPPMVPESHPVIVLHR